MGVLTIVGLLLASAVSISISNLLTKAAIQRLQLNNTGHRGLLFVYQLVSVLVVLLIWIVDGSEIIVPSTKILPFLVVTGGSGALSLIVIYKGLSLGRMTVIFPLANASPIITFLLAITILRESPGTLGWIGVVLATLAIVSLSSENFQTNSKMRLELLYGVVSLMAWGVYYFAISPLVSRFGILGGTFYASAAVLGILVAWFLVKRNPSDLVLPSVYHGTLIGISGSVGLMLYSVSVTMGPTSIINPLHSAIISLLSILSGVVLLNESLDPRQYVFLGLLVLGSAILSYSVV